MKISKHCLPCLLKQIIKTADIAGTENLDDIFHETFEFLSAADFSKSSPDISGNIYRIFSEKTGISSGISVIVSFAGTQPKSKRREMRIAAIFKIFPPYITNYYN